MREIPCPVPYSYLKTLCHERKLLDREIADLLNGEDPAREATVKRIRSWRKRADIRTLHRWERREVAPIEGRLRSLLVGSMLGDGRLAFRGTGTSYGEFHCTAQRDYLQWKAAIWGPTWSNMELTPQGSGFRWGTCAHGCLNEWQSLFYENRRKGWKRLVPEVTSFVDRFALAIWYLDDGGCGWWPNICFGGEPSSRPIARQIIEKFGLNPEWKPQSNNPKVGYFVFKGEGEADKFLNIVRPHIPSCMSYKLNPGYQGLGWESYATFMLGTMPAPLAKHYRRKIKTFLGWWAKRGFQDGIPDTADLRIESRKKAPSWRRIAKVIIRNDYWCKGLSFSPTKREYDRRLVLALQYLEGP